MKMVGIGDLYIPGRVIRDGFKHWEENGWHMEVGDWHHRDLEQLQHDNLVIEQNGPDGIDLPDHLIRLAADAELLIVQFCPVSKALMDRAPRLKAIGVLRAGMENIDAAEAARRGIQLFHTPGRNAESVSDFAVGLILAEARHIAKAHSGMKQGDWPKTFANEPFELRGKTVGIVGLGDIGRKVIRKLSGFEPRFLAFDPFAKRDDFLQQYGVKFADSLEQLLSEADIVTLHARLTPDTKHLMNEFRLSQMKRHAILINTARSGLVDEQALIEALRSRRIGGAALDVFDQEPLPADHPLLTLPNVTLAPHLAGSTNDAFINTPKLLAERMHGWRESLCT